MENKKCIILIVFFMASFALQASESRAFQEETRKLMADVKQLASYVESQDASLMATQRTMEQNNRLIREQATTIAALQNKVSLLERALADQQSVASDCTQILGRLETLERFIASHQSVTVNPSVANLQTKVREMNSILSEVEKKMYVIADKQAHIDNEASLGIHWKIDRLDDRVKSFQRDMEHRLCILEKERQHNLNVRLQRAQEWFSGIDAAHDDQCSSTRSCSRATAEGRSDEPAPGQAFVVRSHSRNSSLHSDDDAVVCHSFGARYRDPEDDSFDSVPYRSEIASRSSLVPPLQLSLAALSARNSNA